MPTIEEVAQRAAKWAVNLFEARVRDLANGKVNGHSVLSPRRVGWHEVASEFPALKESEGQAEFQAEFDKAVKKRLLWRVLHGKMHAEEWVKKHPDK